MFRFKLWEGNFVLQLIRFEPTRMKEQHYFTSSYVIYILNRLQNKANNLL